MAGVLIVEDEYGIAEVLELMLTADGHVVTVATNGLQALERIAERVPELIITDFMMPVMTGADLGQAIRSMPELAHVPILVTSAVDETMLRRAFGDYDVFIQKPFLVDDLLPIVRRLLERGRPGRRDPGERVPPTDPRVHELLRRAIAQQGGARNAPAP